MNIKTDVQREEEAVILWALTKKCPVFETVDAMTALGYSNYLGSRATGYKKTLAVLQRLEKEGTLNSLLTTMNGRVWWLVERIVKVMPQKEQIPDESQPA